MKALISHCQIPILPPKSSFHLTPNYFYYRKCQILKPHFKKSPLYTSISASCYNGWDELMIRVDSDELGESNYIKRLILLLGFDDKKYFFIWVVGFVSALVVSRVRVSSLVVFPSIAIVFGLGFSFGLLNGGPKPKPKPNNGSGFVGPKKESLRVLVNKLRSLVELFDGFDVKVGELKGEIKNAIEFEAVGVSDLEGYVSVVESFGVFVSNARNVIEDCIDGIVVDDRELHKNLVNKHGRKSKETRGKGFDLFGFVGRFFNGNGISSKLSEIGSLKRDVITKEMNDRTRESLQGSTISSRDFVYREKTKLDDVDLKTVMNLQNEGMDNEEVTMSSNRFTRDGRFSHQNFRYMNYQRVSSNTSAYRETRRWVSDEGMSGNIEFELGERYLESDAFLNHQKNFGKSREAYKHNENQKRNNYASYMDSLQKERMNVDEDRLHSRKYLSQQENGSSSFSSNDLMFDKCLTNANALLKQAKECLEIANNEMLAEDILHESAQLLTQAVAMKPMSSLAISQLGNTYLLHGELKLRSSRELRRILSKNDDDFVSERSNLLDQANEMLANRDRITNLLVNACEECETLLVEAGRKYRTALAIDGHDLAVLYNWGLALSYRAQLIANIGPEAALDADKLFLAAIDKFDAMMSRSNVYAPQALYRWGAALQQRSRLRPSNSRDKVKLLQQAKTLYEDALDMGFNSLQVRKALSSCISELHFYGS